MKKIYKSILAVAAAAMALSACVREPEMLPAPGEQTIQFTAESIETRTAFTDPEGNSYPVLWTENDKEVKVMLNMVSNKNAAVTPSDDFKTATFSATFKDTTYYKFFALCPASAWLSSKEGDGEKIYRLGITVPTTQTPTAKSVDEAAQILVAQSDKTYEFDDFTPLNETVSFNFKHWTAYGKLSLTELALGDAKIEAVDLTAEEPWAGRWYYFFSDGHTEKNTASNTITVNTTSASDIWFACAPVDLSGKKLKVVVKTDKGTVTKEVTLPANREFKSGQVARFSINMKGSALEGPKVYELVTKSEDLLYKSQVIIAAAAQDYEFAVGTTQNQNNRAAASVTKTDGKIVDPGSNVEIFTVEGGTASGTYAFKGQDGQYIYAPGTGNHLRSSDQKTAAASWKADFKEGYVILEASTDRNQRFIRFNKSNSTFSCYAVNSGVRDSVALYKLVGSGEESFPVEKKDPGLRLSTLSLTLEVGGSADLNPSEIAAGYDGTISFVSSEPTVVSVDEEGMATALKAGTAKVTVSASETETFNAASKVCTITVTDPSAAMTIAQLLAKTPSEEGQSTEETYTMNEATVMAVSGAYVIVKDASGVMLLYKSGTGLVAGDRITATGKMQNFYGLAEFSASAFTKVSSGATVDHGTPVAMDEAALASYADAPLVQYAKLTGTLPADGSNSSYMKVGSQNVALYDKEMFASYYGMQADVCGYTIGTGKSGQVNFINTSVAANASSPFLTVSETSKTWAADATDAFTVTVSVETGGSWTFTASGMDWATVAKSGNTLVVTPKAANTSSTAKEGTVTLTNSADATKKATVTFTQSAAGSVKYVEIDLSNVQEGQYVIAGASGSKTYIMKNAIQSQYYTAATEFDLSAGTEPEAENIFTIKKSGSGYTIQGNDGKYVYIAVSGTHYNLLPNSSTAYVWTLAAGSNGGVLATGSNSGKNAMAFDKGHNDFTTRDSVNDTYIHPTFYRIVK